MTLKMKNGWMHQLWKSIHFLSNKVVHKPGGGKTPPPKTGGKATVLKAQMVLLTIMVGLIGQTKIQVSHLATQPKKTLSTTTIRKTLQLLQNMRQRK